MLQPVAWLESKHAVNTPLFVAKQLNPQTNYKLAVNS